MEVCSSSIDEKKSTRALFSGFGGFEADDELASALEDVAAATPLVAAIKSRLSER